MILDEIVQVKKEEIKNLKKATRSLFKCIKERNNSSPILIAEIKKASPSKGIITVNFNPRLQLEKYLLGGAAAISILTDQHFFQGSPEIIKKLRPLTELPILRKDFILDPLQIYESYILGADIILLIAAILEQKQLINLLTVCQQLGLEVIVEVHNLEELKRVMETPASIIGINNRNLKDFSVDLTVTERLIRGINQSYSGKNYFIISESGIHQRSDIDYLQQLGVDGVLIGEALMKADDPIAKIHELGLN